MKRKTAVRRRRWLAVVAAGLCIGGSVVVPVAALAAPSSSPPQTLCSSVGQVGTATGKLPAAGSAAGGAVAGVSGLGACKSAGSKPSPGSSSGVSSTTVPGILGIHDGARASDADSRSGMCSSLDELGVAVATVEGVGSAVDETVSGVASRAGCAGGSPAPVSSSDSGPRAPTSRAAASANPLCSILSELAAGVAQAPVISAEVQGAIEQLESAVGCGGSGGTGSNPLCSTLTQVGSGISQVPALGPQLDTLVTQVASGLGCTASSVTSPATPPAVAAAGSSTSAPPANAVTAPANFTG